MPPEPPEDMVAAMKKAAAALRDAGVPFALGGGFAMYARGGPPTDHDIDFMIKADDVGRALEAVTGAGMKTERPPEGWLVKAHDGDVTVDLIFEPSSGPVTDELLREAGELNVRSMRMRVLRPEDLLVSKLMALTEHTLDYESILEATRSLREQVDWREVRKRTEESPFARVFFVLAAELGLVEASEAGP